MTRPDSHPLSPPWAALASLALALLMGCPGPGNTIKSRGVTLQCGRLSQPDADRRACLPLTIASVDEQDVAFESLRGDGSPIPLRGTLSRPTFPPGVDPPDALPAVLLIGDDGPLSRDGVIDRDAAGPFREPVPFLRQLAEALSRRGYVVLRADKRTCAACTSNPLVQSASWDELVGDATAAARFLVAQPGVEPQDLIIIGHGQGVALALDMEIDASALVALGANALPIDQVMIQRARRQLEALESDAVGDAVRKKTAVGKKNAVNKRDIENARRRLAEVESTMLALDEGAFPEDFLVLDLHMPSFWKGWLEASRRIPQALRAFNGDVLVAQGEDDLEAGEEDLRAFADALKDRPGAAVAPALPGLSHALHRRDGPGQISDEALVTIIGWLGRQRP